ncbi:MAG: hypothetical protein CHACPFDD_00722 [Phycisphaerae bacterium]|nr:hypothetical protein [Phycisphaerae bacterium]
MFARVFILAVGAWCIIQCPPAAALPQDQAASAPTTPASLAGPADSGVYVLYKDEDRLATIRFDQKADGTLESHTVLSLAGQTVEMKLRIACDAHGVWESMQMETPQGPVAVQRADAVAKVTHKEKVTDVALKPGALLFENLSPALMSQAVRLYDFAKGGDQKFPLLIIPQITVDASLEYKDEVERSVGGKDYTLRRYVYHLPGVDITVWADAAGRVYLGDVPAQHAAYVREGFESLRQEPQTDPLLSAPTHAVSEQRGVMIAMRDGVKLATDVYRPDTAGKHPVILIRTPYKKEMSELTGRYYARRGYVCAIQDCRGRFGSEGVWEPFINEAKDGYDAIEWLAVQPWSSGKVGMIGGSYVGWVQWWAASQKPPHLATIIPNVSPPDPFYNIPYEYGTFFLWGAIWWADVLESNATADLSGEAMSKIGEKQYHKLLRALPVIDLDKAILGKANPYWRKWIEHPVDGGYWEDANFLDKLKDVRIPVFHQSGWFDGDGIGSKLNYQRMATHDHPHQKLVLGPWGHTDTAARLVGERDFTEKAIIDLQRDYLRWFDHWLKGVDNGIDREPLVSIFVMEQNEWLHGPRYPLPQTRFEKWYLSSGGNANTTSGDGRFSPQAPPAGAPQDRYTYDPGDPTPCPYFPPDDEATLQADGQKKEKSAEEKRDAAIAYYKRLLAERKDILVYESEPLSEPLTFAGPVSAVLYASSSAKDTDWIMRLSEIDENGKVFNLGEARQRARFRNSTRQPELLEPGEIYEYRLDLWQTGIQIRKGRKLRVEVASATFPLFSRNLNTGGHNEKDTQFVAAEQTIYHDAQHPSHVLLPVIPATGEAHGAAPAPR